MLKLVGVVNYIIVIFLNAFTDLGHKIIIQNTIFKVYDGSTQIVLTAIVNALILLPFILVFSPSGFLADRFPKNKIMEYSSVFAVVITLVITYSYYQGEFLMAFAMTFLLALQSAIYGPAKYGYIKELVGAKYISKGNAAIQATTTVAILGGIIFYSALFEGLYDVSLKNESEILTAMAPIAWLLVGGSLIEWFIASKLPNKMLHASKRNFLLKDYIQGSYLRRNLKITTRKKEIFDAIIALSLFWSISQVILAIFGEYAKREMDITNTLIVQGIMALAGIGIVLGSILAAQLSKHYINLGLSFIGAFFITIIVFLVPFVESIVLMAFIFMLFGVFSGFIMVPLNARIQLLAPRVHLGTILAGNNFIQNIFMVSFLALTTLFAYEGMDGEILFYIMGGVGIYMSYRLFNRYDVETFWAVMKIASLFRHKYTYVGLENIPKNGAVLLISNHVSWLDWILLQLPLKRHINFLMDKDIYYWRGFHSVFKKGKTIPISSKGSKDAFKEASKRLKNAEIVSVFAEGSISKDGKIGKFHKGYELIDTSYDGVIIPVFIDGVFGSFFSKYKPEMKKNFFKRREITLYFGVPVSKETKADELKGIITTLKEKYETQ